MRSVSFSKRTCRALPGDRGIIDKRISSNMTPATVTGSAEEPIVAYNGGGISNLSIGTGGPDRTPDSMLAVRIVTAGTCEIQRSVGATRRGIV